MHSPHMHSGVIMYRGVGGRKHRGHPKERAGTCAVCHRSANLCTLFPHKKVSPALSHKKYVTPVLLHGGPNAGFQQLLNHGGHLIVVLRNLGVQCGRHVYDDGRAL